MLLSASRSLLLGDAVVLAAFTGLIPTLAGDVLTEELGRYSWCLCFLSPAEYVRVQRLSRRSPSFMFQRTVPILSSVEASRADFAAPCVTQKESGVGSMSLRRIASERCFLVNNVSCWTHYTNISHFVAHDIMYERYVRIWKIAMSHNLTGFLYLCAYITLQFASCTSRPIYSFSINPFFRLL